MAESILLGEASFLGLGTQNIGDFALLLDDRVAAFAQGERLLQQSKMIEFRAGRMLEWLEPCRMQEVRHLDPVDGESVLFDRVAHFVGVFRAVGRLHPQVRNWVDDHLEQFVARGDAHEFMIRQRSLDEDLRDRLPVLGQIVITQRAGGVGVVEIHELPFRGLGRLRVVELHRIAPDRQKVLVVAFLQGGRELVERHAEIDGCLVDARDGDEAALPGLGRMNDVHSMAPIG